MDRILELARYPVTDMEMVVMETEMTSPQTLETDRLAELILQKYQVLKQLNDLARQQADLITHGDMSKLLTLLATKQRLLIQVQGLERSLNPFRQQDPEKRQWRTTQVRQQAAEAANRCEILLSEIMMIEQQSEAEMVKRRDSTEQQLQAVNRATHARHAYVQKSSRQPGRLDVTQ